MIVYEVQTDGMVSHSTPPYSGWTIPTCCQSEPPPSHQTKTIRMKKDIEKVGWPSHQSIALTFASL
jgi:hypothetical protein